MKMCSIRCRSHVGMVALALMYASCGGDRALESRFVAVHNAMSAMGMAQTGPISEGNLAQGGEARLEAELVRGECYTFVALGGDHVQDLDLRVVDQAKEEVARDTTHDSQAAAQVCPERSGPYTAVVRMTTGQGPYAMSFWSGTARGGSGAAIAGGTGSAGTCDSPIPVEFGRPAHGDTRQGVPRTQGSCAQGGAPEQVYAFELESRAQLRAVVETGFDGSLYILRQCGQSHSEVACNDDTQNTSRSEINTTLDPGSYFLVVDGYGNEAGTYDLVVETSDLQSLTAICDDAAPLPVGQPVSGSTAGVPNYFQATCAGGARSPDRVYRLEVSDRSRLRVHQESDHDGALHLRRACAEPSGELACNDDYGDNRHSLVTAVLDPGRYFVYADGFGGDQEGNYTLTAELVPGEGGSVAADTCSKVGSLVPSRPVETDTLEARDDFRGSCGGQGSPDVVYEFSVRQRSRIRVNTTASQFDAAIYIRRSCEDASGEVACKVVSQSSGGVLDSLLQPGKHFLIVDGQRPEAFGRLRFNVELSSLRALERTCRGAKVIRPGDSVTGSTSGQSDDFQASCGAQAQSGDAVYRLRLRRRQTIRATLSSQYDGVLHLRRTCADASTEIACNDDHNDNRHSFIEQTLDAGTYYLMVDGFRSGNGGDYTLDVQATSP